MAKAPPQNVGGQPQQQMQMVQVYVVPMPYSADGQQQAQWSTPDQPPASGSFGAGSHMSSAAMQQTGPSQWNQWQEMPNQQFANQPQHQTALQDYSGWAPGHQPMQDPSQQGWAQPGSGQQHQQHGQQQQQPMMAGGTPQQPMIGNGQQQPMMGGQQMVQMMPQDHQQYYFVPGNQMQGGQMPGNQQAPPQMPITNNNTPPSTTPAPAAPAPPPAAAASAAPAAAKTKKRGLMNKKLGKDGVADDEPGAAAEPEPAPLAAPAKKEPEPQPKVEALSQSAANAAKAARFEEVAARTAITGVGDSRSMIKALNLQPIAQPSAKGRAAGLRGKEGGPRGRAEEIQSLKDFAASQKSKNPVEDAPAAPSPTVPTPTPQKEEAPLPIEAPQQQPVVPQVQQQQPQPVQQQAPPAQQQVVQMQQTVMQPVMQPVMQQIPNQGFQQFQPPQPQAPQAQATAGAPAGKTKGVRLKNVGLSRAGQPTEAAPEPAPKPPVVQTRVIKTPVVMDENMALTEHANVKVEEPTFNRPDAREQAARAKLQNAVLLGRTNGFDRTMMLQFWRASKACVPVKDLGYRTALRDEQSPSPMETWRMPRKERSVPDQSPASWRTGGGKSGKNAKASKDVLKPGVNAYKIQKAQTREAELQRDVRALLNKICPENKDRIIERLAQTQLDTVEEMEIVINIIFHKVTDDPHYCETYVDMIHALNKAYPEFPPEEEGGSPATFRRMLVNSCQDKFEEMLQKLEEDDPNDPVIAAMEADELLEITLKKKRNAMATMKFIGNLFVRQLLAAAVIRRVIGDLLDNEPPEMQVEYALELVSAVGRQFENTEKDKAQISIILDRLTALKGMKNSSTSKPLLSKRVQFAIEDMVTMRGNGWIKKGAVVAKKLDQVAQEQQREERQEASHSRGGHGKGYGKGGRGGH